MSNQKEEYTKFAVPKNLRLTKRLSNLISAKAIENNTSESELIRQALMQYLNRNLNDTEIIHASLVEMNKKMNFLEKKLELLAIICMEQTRYLINSLPEKKGNEYKHIAEKFYEEFVHDCEKSLKENHKGILESMILDFYEQGNDE